VAARTKLAEDGVRARVVSMPCREWFDEQETSYRETVIPPTVKARVSVEAGIGQGWREVVGDHGRIVSVEQYGHSAEYSRIFTEYGITADAVAAAAQDSIAAATG
jgi:transketolase